MGDGGIGAITEGTTTLSLDELLARAESAVANLQDEFEASADDRVRRMAALLRGSGGASGATAKELRRLSHDLKGEAGSFGFDLLGDVAGLLSHYLRSTPETDIEPDVLSCFAGALETTWEQRLRGEGGAVGACLLQSLRLMAEAEPLPA